MGKLNDASAVSYPRRVLILYLAFAVSSLQLGVSLPFQLYAGNADEFGAGPLNLLQHLAIPSLLAPLIPAAIFALLRGKCFRLLVGLILGLAVALYAQGELRIWQLGTFDGKEIQWEAFRSQVMYDYAMWAGVLLMSILLSTKLAANAFTVSAALILLQIVGTAVSAGSFSGAWHTPRTMRGLDQFYRFSPESNVVVIVLDTFESPAFKYIIGRHPEYADYFKGFTYYRNTLGSFPTTLPSIPAILSGQTYDNSRPIKQFMGEVLPEHSLPAVMSANGYQVDMTTLSHFCPHFPRADSCISLDAASNNDFQKVEETETAKLLDLVLFRSLPGKLKQWMFNAQNWRFQQRYQRRKGPPQHVNSIEFVETFKRHAEASSGRPTFKFLHLMVPHLPLRLDASCNYSEDFRKVKIRDYSVQARCGLHLADEILNTLRRIGVFDQSLIFVLGDHGFTLNFFTPDAPVTNIAKGLPLLLIKPPHSEPLFTASDVPAALTDLPATALDVLAIRTPMPGHPILKLEPSEDRERRYYSYRWKNDNWGAAYLPLLKEYVVKGDAWKGPSWSAGRDLPPQGE